MIKRIMTGCILVCFVVTMLCGCTQIINSQADELKAYTWVAENENGTTITLSFDINYAEMNFYGKDEITTTQISGSCIVSENGFIITETTIGEILYFGYTISGDIATITYMEQEIQFKKAI